MARPKPPNARGRADEATRDEATRREVPKDRAVGGVAAETSARAAMSDDAASEKFRRCSLPRMTRERRRATL